MNLLILSILLQISLHLQIAECKEKLYILGLYPETGNGWTEPFVEYSAELALKHITENGSILSDYEIQIDWKDTKCDGGVAVKEFIDALAKNQNKTYLAVFGGGCSVATSEVAAISFRYGLAQIAYASTAPNLGNKFLYPKFVRGVPSDLNAVPARARFIEQNNWKRVAIINEQDPIFVASSHFMETVLDKMNVEYRVEDFANNGTIEVGQQVRTIADNLRGNGYRIIIANMYEDAAIRLFCELYKQKETYLLPNIATWIFLGWFTDQWNNKPDVLDGCTAEQIANISNGALGFLVAHSERNFRGETNDSHLTVSNRTRAEIYKEYMDLIIGKKGDVFEIDSDLHDAYVYDSTWIIALALQAVANSGTNLTEISQKSILKDEYFFNRNSSFGNDLYTNMLAQKFEGWTGRVEFKINGHESHERFHDKVQLLEFVEGNLEERLEFINIPYSSNSNYSIEEINAITHVEINQFSYWKKETASDGIQDTRVPTSMLCIAILLSIIIIVYVTFLIIVIIVGKFRNLRAIQNSSPILTCIILVGNYLLVLAGVFYISNDRIVGHDNPGLMSNFQDEKSTTQVCNSSQCKFLCMFPFSLLLIASSLIFGGMIGKASIIYLLAVRLRFDLSDKVRLLIRFSWPLIFTCVDVVFVIIWALVSSLVMKSEVQPTGQEESPFIRIIQCRRPTEYQTVSDVFIGLLIVYKSVVVLIGLVMAYNLRNVKKNSLRYWGTITWTMYNMTIFTFVLIMSFFLIEDYVIKKAVISALVLITGLITSTITGLPSVYYMFRDPNLLKEKGKVVGIRSGIAQDNTMLKKQVDALQKDKSKLEKEINCIVQMTTETL